MDYEDENPRRIPANFLRLASGFFSIIYFILAITQILISSGYLDDPSGIISQDIVGGFILLVISSTFAVGSFLPGRRAGEVRSFFLVGSFLAVVHGITGLLVNVSVLVSDLMGIGEEEFEIVNIAEPSIILSLMIILTGALLIWILKVSGKRRVQT